MPSLVLPSGRTAYELSAEVTGPMVVLLHGGSIPMWSWDLQVPALVKAGCRVLRYDMLGKGESAIPGGVLDRDLFRRQLVELLDALEIRERVHLVGSSFGGATAVNFAAHHPERVRSLALIAPALRFDEGNRILHLIRVPVLGDWFLNAVVMGKVVGRASALWRTSDHADDYTALFEQQRKRPGFGRALLSFLRSDALGDYSEAYQKIGCGDLRVLLIWGTDDQEIPAHHIRIIRNFLPSVEYRELAGVGHGVVFEAADTLNAMLTDFLT